jgi:energy-coupling factor transporter ATP-binding protein EcfA2
LKATRILLRWYKSFNINYRREGPARHTEQVGPWNRLHVGDKLQQFYPFIEIPLEGDITTVVGGNETGKSHLLSAIAKVLIGHGIDGALFQQTDLCRYASVPENIDSSCRWANIGIRFDTTDDGDDLAVALRKANITDPIKPRAIAVVVGDPSPEIGAHVYIDGGPTPRTIKPDELKALRSSLPRIQFIDAKAALPDNLTFDELSNALGKDAKVTLRYPQSKAQSAASFLQKLALEAQAPPGEPVVRELRALQRELERDRENVSDDAELAVLLLRDVLDISTDAILGVLKLSLSDRGYIDYHVNEWNRRIVDRLNLRKFWRQDDNAALTLRYRDGILYFDITDKTGATYTFKERSSGLRYFLSYYIQAKALEVSHRNRNAVILMDEPDSFLSILGQRNLLAVFESLVSYESSSQTCQLVYTTHSPFLINQNFPRRVRVVTKEEAEEGTQYQGRSSSRRYEPVRSALGINCAQTLFMGATNLVLEGPTDQYLLTEVIRTNLRPDTVSAWLDLNSIAIVSADGVDNVEKVLSASQWGDEPIPATVVVIDSVRKDVIERITGKTRASKRLVEREFALALDELLADEKDKGQFITIEDVIPWRLYCSCLARYAERWKPAIYAENAQHLREAAVKPSSAEAHVKYAERILQEIGGKMSFDKLGVLAEVVRVLAEDREGEFKAEVLLLSARVQRMCRVLNARIEDSRHRASHRSVANNVKRLIREFLQSREHGCSVIDAENVLARIDREARTIDDYSEKLRAAVANLRSRLDAVSQSGQSRLAGQDWSEWKARFEFLKRDPFNPSSLDGPDTPAKATVGSQEVSLAGNQEKQIAS